MLGEIRLFAFDYPPTGWAVTNGQLLPIAQNTLLYATLGTAYGGNGQTNFALPDLRGRTPVGAGSTWGLGQTAGTASTTLSALPAITVGTELNLATVSVLTSNRQSNLTTVKTLSRATLGSSGQPVAIRPPSLGLNYSIALQGNYGDRECLVGEVIPYAGTYWTSDSSFLPADGRLLSIAQYSALFSLLGTSYGGNGQTNFALPDLRERVPVGAGQGYGLEAVPLGARFGASTVTVTANHLPANLGYQMTTQGVGVLTSSRYGYPIEVVTSVTPITGSGNSVLSIQPPVQAVNYLICVRGIFPSRP